MRLTFVLAAAWLAAGAHAASPRLGRLEPFGGQRGTEVTVVFRGDRIGQDPHEILLYEPGIEVRDLKTVDDNSAQAVLAIAADCPLGIHALRVRTATGLTNLRTFHVSALPELAEEEPNSAFDAPQAVPLGCVVNGVITSEDVDYFVVEADEGERLSVEVEGLRLGQTFFDPAVAILDDGRFEIAAADDSTLVAQDCTLSVLAPKAGRYVVELRETSFRGDDNCAYRLHIGSFPRPTAAFPGGGPPGTTVEVRWLGDPRGAVSSSFEAPETPPLGLVVHAPEGGAGGELGAPPTGVPFRTLEAPNVVEAEPNDELDAATAAELPAALCGVIDQASDVDRFRFAAKQGEVWDFQLVARAIRSPLDGVIVLRKAGGEAVASADDNAREPDGYFRATIPEDGEYVAEVRDHLRQGGPTYVYRLEVTRPRAAVDLALEERDRYEATTIVVPQAGRMAVMATANRIECAGELDVGFTDLPEGVAQEKFPLLPDYNRVPILLTAAEEAPLAGALVPVVGKFTDGATAAVSRFRQQTWLVRGSNNVPVWSHWADRAAVAVVAPAPFNVRLVEPSAPLVQNGSKALRIVAERAEGFDGRIAVRMLYDPPGVSSHQGMGIDPGATEVDIPLTAGGGARVGDWPLVVIAEADVNGPLRAATGFARLRVAEPYLALTFPSAATEQGRALDYTVAVEQRTAFEGTARVDLLGLPPGVTASPQEITRETTEVTFPLTVAADARVGHHKQIFCQVTILEHEEPVVHAIGGGQLRIDAPPAPETAAADASAAGGAS